MKAAVAPTVGSKFQVTEIFMLLIVTAGCVLVHCGENPARKFDRVTWLGFHRLWTIAGMALKV